MSCTIENLDEFISQRVEVFQDDPVLDHNVAFVDLIERITVVTEHWSRINAWIDP